MARRRARWCVINKDEVVSRILIGGGALKLLVRILRRRRPRPRRRMLGCCCSCRSLLSSDAGDRLDEEEGEAEAAEGHFQVA